MLTDGEYIDHESSLVEIDAQPHLRAMQTSRLLAVLGIAAIGCAEPLRTPAPSNEATMHDIEILDSRMAYREAGNGPTIVLLHGNPSSSFVWRNVLPSVAERARALAPDLIGMGASGKPDIGYRFADHARYLDAWIEALALTDIVFVGYDWGGSLAMDWAARHPDRVRGLVVFETFLRPLEWNEWTPQGAELFRALRTPGVGEKMVLEQNQFLERSLANDILSPLTEDVRAAYYAPYPDPKSRLPLLQWPREIPIEGQPADAHAAVVRYDEWLRTSTTVPKLLLTFAPPEGKQPSPTSRPGMVEWAHQNMASVQVTALGPAGHHAPEDAPAEIAQAITSWLDHHHLTPPR
jgi:haloalkane dehalogenase